MSGIDASAAVALTALIALGGVAALLGATVLMSRARARDAAMIARMRRETARARDAARPAGTLQKRMAEGGPALPFYGNPNQLVRGAGLRLSGRAFVAATLGAAIVLGGAISLSLGPLIGGPLGIGLGVFVPVVVLRRKRDVRLDRLSRQLPDALDLMARGLRVGHPVAATIGNVARTMPDPIGTEFALVAQQIRHGDYLPDAFSDLADRVRQEDIDYFAASIRVQHGTGGNLAEMIETLSQVVRARLMLRRRVKSLSAEGRLSALLLSSLPFLIYGATSIIAPDYYGAVRHHPAFLPIAGIVIALVVTNGLILRRLTRFEM
ncbi:Bacterial type II secretion system protein F domain protein [Roseivivax jejudonensis]|uniref:Bacterial type II secretion system protein F domain protein n=1 Tax=Roseivivax jejudonensis TaxID=1529041 RepID=A0A1X6ZB37_9RHOB|nr:type II secretion system F family protein [Roseivivax jejudonensis]SLN46441.1 Bacterial type II secretion system protein F domain protein [Roseivivax jejudonensis]